MGPGALPSASSRQIRKLMLTRFSKRLACTDSSQKLLSVLRVICCWQIALIGLLIATPGTGLARTIGTETVDREAPAEELPEEQSGHPELLSAFSRIVGVRRISNSITRSPDVFRTAMKHPQVDSALAEPRSSDSGHHLPNGLCAPLRC